MESNGTMAIVPQDAHYRFGRGQTNYKEHPGFESMISQSHQLVTDRLRAAAARGMSTIEIDFQELARDQFTSLLSIHGLSYLIKSETQVSGDLQERAGNWAKILQQVYQQEVDYKLVHKEVRSPVRTPALGLYSSLTKGLTNTLEAIIVLLGALWAKALYNDYTAGAGAFNLSAYKVTVAYTLAAALTLFARFVLPKVAKRREIHTVVVFTVKPDSTLFPQKPVIKIPRAKNHFAEGVRTVASGPSLSLDATADVSLFTHCAFTIGDKEVTASRYNLVKESEVFRAMFSSRFKETADNQPIPIKDVDPEAFMRVLHYCHGEFPDLRAMKDMELMRLMAVAHSYGVERLVALGKQELATRIQKGNLNTFLKLADLLEGSGGTRDFTQVCDWFMMQNGLRRQSTAIGYFVDGLPAPTSESFVVAPAPAQAPVTASATVASLDPSEDSGIRRRMGNEEKAS